MDFLQLFEFHERLSRFHGLKVGLEEDVADEDAQMGATALGCPLQQMGKKQATVHGPQVFEPRRHSSNMHAEANFALISQGNGKSLILSQMRNFALP